MKFRKLIAIIAVLSVMMCASQLAYAESANETVAAGALEAEKLPELTAENLNDVMAQQMEKYKTKDNVCPMLWQGLLEMDIAVGEDTRTAKLYVPENNPQGTSFIMMNTPEGIDAVTFIYESGWKEIADKEQMPLFVMEPADGKSWGTAEEEKEYFAACCAAEKAGVWLNPGFCRYMIGYGEVGSALQKYVMEDPLTWGGAAFLDANDLSEDYLKATGDTCVDTETKKFGLTLKEVPTPVILIDKDMDAQAKAVLAYWETAANDPNALERYSPEGKELLEAAVVSEQKEYEYNSPATTKVIWDHIGQFYRYGNGWLSNSLHWRVDYDALGVEFKSFTDSSGIDRNYMVYVPEEYRNSDEKLPLVLTIHGSGNTMRQQFENTLWHQLADKEGFIVVSPETTLVGGGRNPASFTPKWSYNNVDTGYTDAIYFNDLLDILEKDYHVDPSRIYANGHSLGCGEVLYLCQTAVGDRFAAVAPTAGLPIGPSQKAIDAIEQHRSQIVPTFVFMGEYDLWDSRIDVPENENLIQGANGVLLRTGLATEDNVDDVRLTGADESYVEGRYNNTVWHDENGVPLFRYTWVKSLGHAVLPEQMEMAWYEWLSQYTLDVETGTRIYQGETVIG